jgi:hypothetical protein
VPFVIPSKLLLNCARFVKPEGGPADDGDYRVYSSWENSGKEES